MILKFYISFVFAFIFVVQNSFSNQCDNFYAKITYGLSHSKKAMKATNFEHQMYYAERAKTALEQSKAFIVECNCAKSEDKTLDAIETLEKAISPSDWDTGRFFTKKAIDEINELITIVDNCTLNASEDSTLDENNDISLDSETTEEAQPAMKSMEMEMIAVFNKHAKENLKSTKKAIDQLIQFSKSFNHSSDGRENDPNSLASHQKAYMLEAKKLLEKGLKSLEEKN